MAVTSSVEPAAMRPLFRRCVAFAPLLLLVLLVSDQNISARPRMPVDMPPLVLWAWDRDDDLSFIDIRDTAVAYLAATVILRTADAFTPSTRDAGMPKHTPRSARGYVNGQMLLVSIDPRHPALGSCAYCVGDRSTRAGNQILQPLRTGSGGRSCVFPWASRHPASHLHRQSALRRLPDHAGRALLGCAGQAVARALLRCSGDAFRRGDELERPAQARSRRAACQGGYVVPTAAGGHAHLRRFMLSERLSQFRRDAARAHRRSRRQQSAGARMGDRPGRRPPQL